MSNRLTNALAFAILALMLILAFYSMKVDSLTFDELAHIPAGYSYLTQKDYRINPEHPPLVKDLAAIPLLFLDLKFPKDNPAWTQDNAAPAWWVQFDLGTEFIYRSGNDPRDIILYSRIPMILLLLLLGWKIFFWAKQMGGNYVGLAALSLFAFSPTFLAHGRLVTTDVGAALGVVVSTYLWLAFLKDPSKKNIFLAGLAFGLAMLLKFSLILLIPFFGILTIIYPLIQSNKDKFKNLALYLFKAVIAGLIGLILVIWPVYQFHVSNYPVERQIRDTAADLAPNKVPILKNLTLSMAKNPLLRPLAQYFRGVLMAMQRTSFGNTVFFLGKISASGWKYYFPIIYLLKEPLPFHLMTLFVIIGMIFLIRKKVWNLANWIRENFTVFSLLLFLGIYWSTAILGKLNIGVRHILPTFPFIYLLVALGLKTVIKQLAEKKQRMALAITFVLFFWLFISALLTFPHYISYFNELAGGTKNGYKYAVDSNYDWGQDFYRLMAFIEEKKIDKIYIDYFGGENIEYWLGDKYIKLDPKQIKEPPKGWIAVSLNQFMGGVAEPVPGFDQEIGYYQWLNQYQPVERIGYSILIYHID